MDRPPGIPWTRSERLCVAGAIALMAAAWSYRFHPEIYEGRRSDFAMIHAGATAFLAGVDPYTFIGPGRAYDHLFPLVYPFTALIVAVPFTYLPLPDALFAGLGAGLFGWGVASRLRYRYALFALCSPAFIYCVQMSQWSGLMVGSALVPAWGFLLACKPTIGAALFAAYPSRRTLGGALVLLALSLLWLPTWPSEWLATLRSISHTRAPVMFWGGPLLLLALLRWRDPEARLLAALALIPHTTELYESLPLFLIPATARQGALLAVLNWGVFAAQQQFDPATDYVSYVSYTARTGQWMVWLLYLPCLAMVLLRPSVWAAAKGRSEC